MSCFVPVPKSRYFWELSNYFRLKIAEAFINRMLVFDRNVLVIPCQDGTGDGSLLWADQCLIFVIHQQLYSKTLPPMKDLEEKAKKQYSEPKIKIEVDILHALHERVNYLQRKQFHLNLGISAHIAPKTFTPGLTNIEGLLVLILLMRIPMTIQMVKMATVFKF